MNVCAMVTGNDTGDGSCLRLHLRFELFEIGSDREWWLYGGFLAADWIRVCIELKESDFLSYWILNIMY